MCSSLFPPETIGGAEKYVENISNRLAERGNDVHVITTSSKRDSQPETKRQNGVTIHRIQPMGLYMPYDHQKSSLLKKAIQQTIDRWNPDAFISISRLLRQIDPDIVHTHNFSGLSGAVFSSAHNQQIPIIHTLHDYRLLDIRPSLWKNGENLGVRRWMAPLRWFNRAVIDQAISRVLSPSQFMLNIHREYGFFSEAECTVLPYGINTQDLDEDDTSVKDSSDEFRLLFVGQLVPQKGILWLAEVIKSMDRSDIAFDILGKGPQLKALKKISSQDNRIQAHGFVTGDELDKFYQQANATIVPSKWFDNSPMVIYESYFQGTPVIGANIGGIPELIQEGVTGFLFNPHDPSSLINSIESAINADPVQLYQGIKLERKKYTMDKHISNLNEEYKKLK